MVRIIRDATFTFPNKDGRSMMHPTHRDIQGPFDLDIWLGFPYYYNNI
jgi:hypothetical protein